MACAVRSPSAPRYALVLDAGTNDPGLVGSGTSPLMRCPILMGLRGWAREGSACLYLYVWNSRALALCVSEGQRPTPMLTHPPTHPSMLSAGRNLQPATIRIVRNPVGRTKLWHEQPG